MRDGDEAVFGREIWRRPIEKITTGLVFKRRLPRDFARRRVFVTPACSLRVLRFWRDPFSAELLHAARALVGDGDTIWDIGANMGVFALAAASRAISGQVVAFEPDPTIAALLRRTLALAENAALDIDLVEAAIGDRDGPGRLNINARSRALNNLDGASIWSAARSRRETVSVATYCLDTVLAGAMRPPDLIKVDIEGAEHRLLRGAERLLRDIRPAWYIEVADENAAEVSSLYRRHGYKVCDGDALVRGLVEGGVFDWLAIPEEAVERYAARVAAVPMAA
jgi:FkbM family methyltransferase